MKRGRRRREVTETRPLLRRRNIYIFFFLPFFLLHDSQQNCIWRRSLVAADGGSRVVLCRSYRKHARDLREGIAQSAKLGCLRPQPASLLHHLLAPYVVHRGGYIMYIAGPHTCLSLSLSILSLSRTLVRLYIGRYIT